MTQPQPSDLRVDIDGAVATVTLRRPDVLNAVRRQTRAELDAALRAINDDDDVRVLVLTGEGRAFTAGQDLRELEGELQRADVVQRAGTDLAELAELTRLVLSSPKATIAALNGVAVGLGAELAIACDLRIASDRARLGFVEVTRGLFETNGVTFLLPRLVGHARATELLLSGRIVAADELDRVGLVHRVVPHEGLAAEVARSAARMALNAPVSMALVKQALAQTWSWTLEDAMAFETEGMLRCLVSDDLRSGTRAFLDRSTPSYEGH